MKQRTYIAIDLKSFYASVECRERGLDPLDTNLVVADPSRTDKTICLAVTPSLKAYGISGRARLFEVNQRVSQINNERKWKIKGKDFSGSSHSAKELADHSDLALDFIIAPPRMAKYMEYSTRIYSIYMKYVAPEDVVVYSIDEVFIDATDYLFVYGLSPRDFAMKMVQDILQTTGITATAGIGTNLYLSKVAMDIVAKHIPADKDGVRIAELDEMSYRRELWEHRPLTDFWRVGRGYRKKLEAHGLYTMGDVARCSEQDEDLLYRLFGKNAELLIDHSWGWEPCTIKDIKAYKPSAHSLSNGQVLHCPYDFDKARLVIREMTDALSLQMVEKHLVSDQIVLTVGYDIENLTNQERRMNYYGEISVDVYGRQVPKHSHGTQKLGEYTSSSQKMMEAVSALFDRIADPKLLIRRMYIVADHVIDEADAPEKEENEQLCLFVDYAAVDAKRKKEKDERERERRLQETSIFLKKRFGKNALLRGMNFQEGATMRDRNSQIGGHKA